MKQIIIFLILFHIYIITHAQSHEHGGLARPLVLTTVEYSQLMASAHVEKNGIVHIGEHASNQWQGMSATQKLLSSTQAANLLKKDGYLLDLGVGVFRSRYFLSDMAWPSLAVYGCLEYVVNTQISAGAFGGFYYGRSIYYRFPGLARFRGYQVGIPVGVCGSLHFSEWLNEELDAGVPVDKLDIFGRLYLGLNFERFHYRGKDPQRPDLYYRRPYDSIYPMLGLTGGVRYKFQPGLLLFAELGWGPVSSLAVGFTFQY